jgi:hypothetical protein
MVSHSDLFSSPPQKKANGEYSTPVRAKLRGLHKSGWSGYKIIKRSKLPKSSVYKILGALLVDEHVLEKSTSLGFYPFERSVVIAGEPEGS